MRAALADLVDLHAMAGTELDPGKGGSSAGVEQTIGLNVGALDLSEGSGVIGQLFGWCRLWADDLHGVDDWGQNAAEYDTATARAIWGRGQADTTAATLAGVVGYLLRHLDWACANFLAIDEFSAEVGTLWGQATGATRTAARQSWVVECPADHEGGTCGKRLRVTGEDFDRVVVCERCQTHWQVDRLLLVVHSMRGGHVWLPADEVTMLVGIGDRELRRWAGAGLVERDRGRYELGSVRDEIARRRAEAVALA